MLARADPRSAAAAAAAIAGVATGTTTESATASSTIAATKTEAAATISGHVRLLSGGRAPAYL